MTPAQARLAAVRREDGRAAAEAAAAAAAAPPAPVPLSIGAAKATLAPAAAAAAWLAPRGARRAARARAGGGVVLGSGALVAATPGVPRLPAAGFAADGFDLPREPAVLLGLGAAWPARDWRAAALAARVAPDAAFGVDGGPAFARATLARAAVSMRAYAEYCVPGGAAAADAAPLYIFDEAFCARPWAADCAPLPAWLAPAAEAAPRGARPLPPAWLLVGAAGSGTPVHAHERTVAANALLAGCKLWVCLPPRARAADVLLGGGDDEELSAAAWVEAWAARGARGVAIVQEPGETVFVPARWWHCVLNVEDSTALALSRYIARDGAGGAGGEGASEKEPNALWGLTVTAV